MSGRCRFFDGRDGLIPTGSPSLGTADQRWLVCARLSAFASLGILEGPRLNPWHCQFVLPRWWGVCLWVAKLPGTLPLRIYQPARQMELIFVDTKDFLDVLQP